MLSWFKNDSLTKLRKQHAKKLEAARDAQRSGKMPLFATLSEEAEQLAAEIDRLESEATTS